MMEGQPNWNNLVCDKARVNNISFLSKVCVDGTDNGTLDCLTEDADEVKYRTALGIWAIVILIVGVFGNALTLLALPYAAHKRR